MHAAVIFSPHLDDAALSCWSVLSQPRPVTVLNFFSGAPTTGELGWWDRESGAADPRQRGQARVAEDETALARAGRKPVNLGFVPDQYWANQWTLRDKVWARLSPGRFQRGRWQRRVAPLIAPARKHLSGGAEIFAPAGIGGHPDHLAVREVALGLASEGCDVKVYAEQPYAFARGWPRWVTGDSAGAGGEVDSYWSTFVDGSGLELSELEPSVHHLDPEAVAAKLEALHCYQTQLPALEAATNGGIRDPELIGWEVFWVANAAPEPGEARA